MGDTWAEISLPFLRHNLIVIRKKVQSKSKIMAVVKADAYGHGAVEVAKELNRNGVDAFAVAKVFEGIELRKAGIKKPILVLGETFSEDIENIINYGLTPSVTSTLLTKDLAVAAARRGVKVKVHIKVDTGMGDSGVLPELFSDFLHKLQEMSSLEVEGVYTHLVTAYELDTRGVEVQLDKFNSIINWTKKKGCKIPLFHAASSAVALNFPEAHYDMVRIGIALYGLPVTMKQNTPYLRPIMSIKAKLVSIKKLREGTSLGYGHAFTTNDSAKIATVSMGYADCFFLNLLKKGEVLVRGIKVPIVGGACMDKFMVDVTHVPETNVGDEVVILGKQGNQIITAEDIAQRSSIEPRICETICFLGRRVERKYIGKKNLLKIGGDTLDFKQKENSLR